MLQKSAAIVFVLAVLSLLAAPAWAGFDEGAEAYKRGDYKTALREMRPLANQGHAEAQNNLGAMYGRGQGVSKDHAKAMKWYREAAKQGYVRAQFNLGFMYGTGQDVPQDDVRANMWWSLAAAGGHQNAARNLTILARRMTPDQIAEAQKLAREWMAKHGKK